MKTILAVWNSGGKGKTESIREFAKLLLITYPGFTAVHPSSIKINPTGDFLIVVQISGKIIGIISQGDPSTGLDKKLIKLVKNHNCDVIVCSTRSSGETVNAVMDVSKKYGYYVVWSSTYEVEGKTEQTFINTVKGKHMLDLLQTLSVI